MEGADLELRSRSSAREKAHERLVDVRDDLTPSGNIDSRHNSGDKASAFARN
jgi:hypothetical protein